MPLASERGDFMDCRGYPDLREVFRDYLSSKKGWAEAPVSLNPLDVNQAIGRPGHADYPLLRGKEVLLREMYKMIMLTAAACLFLSGCAGDKQEQEQALLVYAAAALKGPLEEIAGRYEQDTGVEVRFIFNSSGRLLAQLEQVREGDLFIPGDESFLSRAAETGLARECTAIARQVPLIVVQPGNPRRITGLAGLADAGVRLILADQSTAIGKCAVAILQKNGLYEAVLSNVVAETVTAPQVALAISLGQGDAGITAASSVLHLDGAIELIPIPEEQNIKCVIAGGILTFSKNPGPARNFLAFLDSPASKQILKKYGLEADQVSGSDM